MDEVVGDSFKLGNLINGDVTSRPSWGGSEYTKNVCHRAVGCVCMNKVLEARGKTIVPKILLHLNLKKK